MKLQKIDRPGKKAKNIFEIISPLDGASLGHYKETEPKDIAADVAALRRAYEGWRELSTADRVVYLKKVRKLFGEASTRLVDTIRRETGKVEVEIYGGEIVANLELLDFYIKNAGKILAHEKVSINPLNYPGKKGHIVHRPLGIVGVISSWNYPVALAMRAIVPALASGNAVLFKPSAEATLTGQIIDEIFTEALPPDLFKTVYGNRPVNEAVVEAADKINFIGSVGVGKSIARRCAERLVPCSTELSGKDAAIVLEDCNLERTVNGVIWGGFTNSGQNCASIERVFVADVIYDEFLQLLTRKVSLLKLGTDIGPLRNARQLKQVEAHVESAKKSGARILCGGKAGDGFYFEPTVIAVKKPDAEFMTEETFGPTLPVYKVKSFDEAIDLVNQARFGLTTSIWTENLKAARSQAHRIETGIVTINNSVFTGALASAPWGGMKETGHGVTNSRYGLLEMTRPHLLLVDRARGFKESWWYPYNENAVNLMKLVVQALKGNFLAYLKVPGLLKKVLKKDIE